MANLELHKTNKLTLIGSLVPNTVLREQKNKDEVIRLISGQLLKLSSLYQIQNYGAENALTLAEWIYETYQFESLEDVCLCLNNPPDIGEKIWRINPDTVGAWMAEYLERASVKRERELHNQKFKEPEEIEPDDERLTEWLETLEGKEAVRPITEEEVNKEGQDKPYKPSYTPPGREYKIMMDLKVKYGQECTDLHTGRIKPGMPSFEEWLNLSK